jgi:Phage integrase, N-terminal SAM-like domain
MSQAKAMVNPSLKEVFVSVCRFKHLSLQTERRYWDYIKRFYTFHNKRYLRDLGVPEIRQFLTHLAVNDHVTASTQNVALCSLVLIPRSLQSKSTIYH